MKNLVLILLTAFFVFSSIEAQDFPGPDPKMGNRLRELENLKLIEAMNLDEETSVRFFARRNEHQKNMFNLMEERDSLLTKLAEKVDKKAEDKELDKLYDEIFDLEEKIVSERERFFESLDDIFNPIEKAKLLVFEHKFKREVRNLIMKDRMGRKRGRQ